MKNKDLFYAEVKDSRTGKFLVWVGSWVETIAALLMFFAQWLYHRAGAHGHCSRQESMGVQANLALEQYYNWHALREKYRNARNN